MASDLAGLTSGLVAADKQHVCTVAGLIAARRGADAVAMRDFSDAIDRSVPACMYACIVQHVVV
jgi:ATP-dependent 26S proteasome regulatory subunit